MAEPSFGDFLNSQTSEPSFDAFLASGGKPPAASPPPAVSAPVTGPTFNAPEKLPWYHDLLNRIENVVAGPGAALNESLGRVLNTAQPTDATWQPPTEKPILDLSALKAEDIVPGTGRPSKIARGLISGTEGFSGGMTTPRNASVMAATAGFGEAFPVVSKLLAAGFSLQMLKGAFDQSPQFIKQVQSGDVEGATKTLTEIGLTAAAGVLSAKHAASPEGIAPIAPDAVSRQTAQAMGGSEGVSPEEAARDSARNTPGPIPQRYPENAPPGQPQPQGTPSPRKAAQRPTIPEEGPTIEEQRLADARERLATRITNQKFDQLSPRDQSAVDDLVRQGYGQAVQPAAEPAAQNAPSNEVEKQEAAPSPEPPPGQTDITAAKPPREPEKPVAYGAATKIRIPGENRSYDAVYTVRDESDVYPSHNPFSFEPNPDFEHVNDRNYAEPRNAERVVKQEAEFDPAFLVNDNPDATNGPPIWDSRGNVLGGNSREMTIERVNANRPDAAQAYRDLQVKQATRFGIPPKLIERMGRPVLGREVIGDINPQEAITDFNKTGTAALTQAERAISDSKRLSSDTADYLSRRIEEQGPDGTLAQALEGNGGREIVNRLVDDGVITAQEKPQLLNGDGSMTPEGKQRVGRLLSGQFFSSARELEETPPELRAKLDRIVPSVMRTASREGWDLTEPVKEAVSLVKDAKARGVPVDDVIRQEGLFGTGGHSDDAVAIARSLERKPTEIAKAFRQYASDEALSRPGTPMTMGFEPPTREEAFESAFGSSKTPDNISPESKAAHFAESLPENRLTMRERAMEHGTYNRAKLTIRQLVRQYRERFGDHFSSDKAAELFPEYSRSEASRTANRAAITKASHFLADSAFRDRLSQSDKTPVSFVVGGPGAGKTTVATDAAADGRIVFDGSAVHAEPLIDKAAASGRKVEIQYVHRDPVEAFRGTLDRAMNSPTERGRVIPLQLHQELHRGSADAIKRIADKYASDPNVSIRYQVNSSTDRPRAGSIEDVARTSYSGLSEQLRNVLDTERAAGRVSQAVYDRVATGSGSGTIRERDAEDRTEGSEPGTPGIPGPSDSGSPALAFPARGVPTGRRLAPTPKTPATASAAPPSGPQIASRWATLKDSLLKIVAPAARTEGARETSYVMREMGATLANRLEQAHEALKDARKYFAAKQPGENFDFIDRIENGRTQRTLHDQQIAQTLRQMLDQSRDEVRALGTGKLQSFYENYFPHLWEKPDAARDFFTRFIEKRPLQGSKSFLKQRSLPTFKDGIDEGLKPVSDNPVDLVLAKIHEMNKYLLAHQALDELKAKDLVEYHDATWKPAPGMKRIEDSIATVYGKPTVTVEESYDKRLMDQLNDFAQSLGISHDRLTRLEGAPRSAVGFARPSGEIQTKFGSPEQVLIHEIGHILEYRYKLSNALRGPGIATELNKLAALRWEGENPSAGYKAYARTTDEKMANAIAAMIHIPERFQEVAPKTWDLLRDELYSHPDTRPLLDIKKSMTIGRNTGEVPVGGMVVRGHYWAPEENASIVNNYLSPGLRGNPIYDAYMGLGNTLNQFQLGLSAFHFGTTAMEAMISHDAMAIRKASTGEVTAPARALLSSIVAPYSYYSEGSKVLKAMRTPGSASTQLAQIADAVVKAGGRSRMDKFYDTGMATRMMDAFRRGDIAKGIGLTVPGLGDLSSHWLMKEWVPRLKLGAFSDIAKYELARLGPDATPKDAQAALSRAWDSVDNRFGQVVYDNLFWNKAVKDLAMASTRAVGWNLGSLREGLGGISDTAAQARKMLGGDKTAEVTNRMAYIPAMMLRTGLMGGAMYYLMTGKAPQRTKDYFFPGGHSMPGFLKDAVNWATHPVDTAKGKIHPAATLIWDMLNDKDSFDKPIAPHDEPILKKAEDYAKFVGEQFEPLSIRDAIKGKNPLGADPYQFFGMPKAPRAVRDGAK